MQPVQSPNVIIENVSIRSTFLDRQVIIDFYLPGNASVADGIGLLLINDGQNMEELGLAKILEKFYDAKLVRPLICAAIHTGPNVKWNMVLLQLRIILAGEPGRAIILPLS